LRRASRATRSGSGGSALASLALVAILPGSLDAAPTARFAHLSVEQGLSQSTVQVVLQDAAGFLWFGTEEGLNRYDGYAMVVFKHDPQRPLSIPDNRVTALHSDREGRLWVGTDRGLSLFDRLAETFTPTADIKGRVTGIVEEPDGTLWIGSEGYGLFERSAATGAFVLHQNLTDDPSSFSSYLPSALLRDRAGRLWIGTKNAGLERLERSEPGSASRPGRRFVHHRHDPANPRSLGRDEIWGLAEDAAGHVWVATYGGGLSVLDPETGTFRHHRHRPDDPEGLATDLVTCVFPEPSGGVWIGTDGGGVQQYDPASGKFVRFRHDPLDSGSLSQDVIRTFYQDRQGQLWVGTFLGGVNVLRRTKHPFGYFTHNPTDPHSLANATVASFLEDAEGRLWVGTAAGWLHRYERDSGRFVRYRLPSSLPGALALHQDRRGRIWVGSYRGGLGLVDVERGTSSIHVHRPGDPSSLGNDEVWAIAEDAEGMLWLGTNGGVDRFDPDLGKVTAHYATPREEGTGESAGVRALRFDRRGNLWIGDVAGLRFLQRGGDRLVRVQPEDLSLRHDGVVSLHEDAAGRMWLGTYGGGLRRLDPATGSLTTYKEFASNVIYGIQPDAGGRLWVSTNQGLARFDPASQSVWGFDLTNGLQSLQFHLGASLRTRSGRLLFGSVAGFYDFDPAAITPDTYSPPVVLTSMRIFNEPATLPAALWASEEITLSHRDKVVALEFAALDYSLPRRNRYAYRMEGFTERWIELGAKRDVTFTNLDAGRYTFRVKASNSDGVWNDAAATSLRVIVLPPLWGTWWFRSLAAASVAFVLFAAHRLRVRRLTADLAERRRAEAALRHAEEKYRSIFENAMEGIFRVAPGGQMLAVNPALARMLGYASPEELMAETEEPAEPRVAPDHLGEMLALLGEQDSIQAFECEVVRRDGSTLWVSASARAERAEAGQVVHYEGTVVDVTERKRWVEEARHTVSVLQSTLESTADGILVLDGHRKVVSFNHRLAQLWGISPAVLPGNDAEAFLGHVRAQLRDPEAFLETARRTDLDREAESFDVLEFKDGRVFECYSLPHRLDGEAVGRVWSFRDVTERRRAEEKVEYQAYHDSLTGLPNRLLLTDRLDQALVHAQRHHRHLAVVFLDVDHFKLVNDTLGHAGGDRLLGSVAERLRGCVRADDTVARVGGDEFTLLFSDLERGDHAVGLAEKVLRAFEHPFVIEGENVYVTVSIGLALYPEDGEASDELLRNADGAMYKAKELGRNNYQLCTPGMNARAMERMSLESGLRRALERSEFVLHYQPLVDLATGRWIGTEALVRWQHPQRGLLAPDTFIPLAEESRLILPLGDWVMHAACAQLKEWRDAGLGPLRMSVNLSMRQLQQKDLARSVETALARHGVPPGSLDLEITETVAMHNVEWTKSVLRALRDMGVRISIDDFGTGQSSLSHLKHFPLSTLKIDRSFVRDIAVDPDDEAIVKAVIALAHNLKLAVIAEGVETEEQLAFLRLAGCEEGQGYLFCAPLPAAALEPVLASGQMAPARRQS
jgi:diguanylate cyclase (GGDEF)-like protein/PAS domain S-box-containing protein